MAWQTPPWSGDAVVHIGSMVAENIPLLTPDVDLSNHGFWLSLFLSSMRHMSNVVATTMPPNARFTATPVRMLASA